VKWLSVLPVIALLAGVSCRAPHAEEVGLCADVGALRACWDGDEPRLVARHLPRAAAGSPMGWRCAGQGSARRCVDRRAGAPAFTCAGTLCLQTHPRQPDDGEWSCADSAGATICRGGERPAGVAKAPPDPAWICGTLRAGAALPIGGRVCVDLSPDFPDGEMSGWRCRTSYEPLRRECAREAAAVLTVACDSAHLCVDGSRCVGARCLPRRPAPDCAFDSDCPGRRCRFGTCVEGPP
jgi:hypothetical protein